MHHVRIASLALLALTSCAGQELAKAAPARRMASADFAIAQEAAPAQERAIIRTTWMRVAVDDPEAAAEECAALVEEDDIHYVELEDLEDKSSR